MLLDRYSKAQEKKDPSAKNELQLDANSYRLKVEAILEPLQDYAVYRIQIWTTEKREFCLNIGNVGTAALFRREKQGGLFRADFVCVACIRERKKGDAKADLEFRCMVAGDRGSVNTFDKVDASTRLADLISMPTIDLVEKSARRSVGRFREESLEVQMLSEK